jgi:hypothetical protein
MSVLMKKSTILVMAGAAAMLVVAANAHLIYVAVTSQPDCVAHVRPGRGGTEPGRFGAAGSSCTPVDLGRDGTMRGPP